MSILDAGRPMVRRGLVAGLAVVAGLALFAAPSASAGPGGVAEGAQSHASGPKPTIVLIHGAFADASGWSGVITRLRDRGYPVLAPANPLRGVSADSP
jgi:pimeloyl-ACP methyl ester carboxylesterase